MATATKSVKATARPKPSSNGHTGITITIPLGSPLDSSTSHRVHVDAPLKGIHGATMLRLRAALDLGNMRLRDGRHVHTHRDALMWLMEAIEAAAEAPQVA